EQPAEEKDPAKAKGPFDQAMIQLRNGAISTFNGLHLGGATYDARTKTRVADPSGNRQLAAFHWVNLVLHAGNAILVYLLMLTLTRRYWVAAFTGLIFATHPIAVESV